MADLNLSAQTCGFYHHNYKYYQNANVLIYFVLLMQSMKPKGSAVGIMISMRVNVPGGPYIPEGHKVPEHAEAPVEIHIHYSQSKNLFSTTILFTIQIPDFHKHTTSICACVTPSLSSRNLVLDLPNQF